MSFKSASEITGIIIRSLALDTLGPIMAAQPAWSDEKDKLQEQKARDARLESLWEAQQIHGALANELPEEEFAPYLELIRMKALTDARWNIVIKILEEKET